MERHKLPLVLLARFEDESVRITTKTDWEAWLDKHSINAPWHRKIITEGALMGGLLAQGIPVDLAIISDDAGQFNVFDHALCWIHVERIINRLIPLNDEQVKAVDAVREQLWQLYRDLKAYKLNPVPEQVETIKLRFQAMCNTTTAYATLNQALKRMGNNQPELLRVLDRPELPIPTTT
jgi:hypothetical protein